MLKQYLTILILSFILLTSSNCKKNKETTFDISAVENKLWLHSYEEDSAGIIAYRPEEYNLPPSRGRKGFKIMKDNSFILYSIAAADGWDKHPGKWKLIDEKTVEIDFGNDKVSPKKWEIISLSKDKIMVKEIQKE
jgi:hypothetical protein